jgi:hypothetical protein
MKKKTAYVLSKQILVIHNQKGQPAIQKTKIDVFSRPISFGGRYTHDTLVNEHPSDDANQLENKVHLRTRIETSG